MARRRNRHNPLAQAYKAQARKARKFLSRAIRRGLCPDCRAALVRGDGGMTCPKCEGLSLRRARTEASLG